MRTLHVAALPFPTPQGTQGLLHAMLSALAAHDHDTHLLCYAHGAAVASARERGDEARAYTVHRAPPFGRGSLRSGPSLDKPWLDLGLWRSLRALAAKLRPDVIVAHHVEAAACALAARAGPVVFIAHTSLEAELPTYFAKALAPTLRFLGAQLDVALIRRAARTLAVSPLLASLLTRASGRTVHALSLPWYAPAPLAPGERDAARAALGLPQAAHVVLYAGNFDGYQGLEPMLAALSSLTATRPRLHVLIASAAPRARLAARMLAPIARITFAPLGCERDRRLVHAASDLALVPRRSPGGIPIKLLDALARGVPTVAAPRALAGLPLEALCEVVPGEAASAWHETIARTLAAPAAAEVRARAARDHVARAHTDRAFVDGLLAHLRAAS